MGLIDRLFRRDAPSAPARRSFDAATGGRRAPSNFGRINPEIAAAGETVASRARYLVRNNPWVSNATGNLVTALVGHGIRPNATGLDPETRKTVAKAFDRWAAEADAAGIMDFWGLQSLLAEHLIVDGEALAILHRDPDGLRLQFLDPAQLDRSKTTELSDGRVIHQGVELDARGRRLAFWIIPENPNGLTATFMSSQRVPAEDVIHVLKPVAAGQVRGISHLAPAILPASELDQYLDAALVQAKTSALLSVWLVNQNDLSGDPVDFDAGDLSLEPGVVRTLPGGWDIRSFDPDKTTDTASVARIHLQGLAAALGLPEHLLSGDLSRANYSSLRGGLVPFRQRIEALQYSVLVPQFLDRVWREWLALETLAGRLDVPMDTRAEWIPPKQPWVDPLKDLQATELALRLGLTSRSQAAAEMGWSVEALDAEIAADRERAAALGLTFNPETENADD